MLAAVNISQGATDTPVYIVPSNKTRSCFTISLCNRSSGPITINMSLCPQSQAPSVDGSQSLESGLVIPANTSVERAGLVLLTGQIISIRASQPNVINAVVYGIEE